MTTGATRKTAVVTDANAVQSACHALSPRSPMSMLQASSTGAAMRPAIAAEESRRIAPRGSQGRGCAPPPSAAWASG